MRRHPNDERNRARRTGREEHEGGSDYYDREEEVGRPVTDYAPQSGWEQRGMSGYGGGGSFGGMGYPMTVGGHGTYVAGHRSTGHGYGPGGEAWREQGGGHPGEGDPRYDQPMRSRDWAPYREGPDWPRNQPVGQRHGRPVQREFDSDIHRSYGSGGGDIPRWSSQGEQSFRGRGPKGYRRSDERIREEVCDRLTEDHDIDASDIDLKVENGEVTLEGTVDERRCKWLAEEIAARCSGVVDVHNHLRVKRHHQGQAVGEDVQRIAEGQQPRNGNGGGAQRTSPSRNT